MWKRWYCWTIKIKDTKTYLARKSNDEAMRQQANKTVTTTRYKTRTNEREDNIPLETTNDCKKLIKKRKNLRRKTIQETAKIEDQVKVQRQMTSKKSRWTDSNSKKKVKELKQDLRQDRYTTTTGRNYWSQDGQNYNASKNVVKVARKMKQETK